METKELFRSLINSLNKECNEANSQRIKTAILILINKLRIINDNYCDLSDLNK